MRNERQRELNRICSRRYRGSPKGKAMRARKRRGIAESDLPPPLVPGHCDFCGKPFKCSKQTHWDHDHVLEDLGFHPLETHRGWLCSVCNSGLGLLGDTPQAIYKALNYLQGRLPGQLARAAGVSVRTIQRRAAGSQTRGKERS
jgi:hypothetical protein